MPGSDVAIVGMVGSDCFAIDYYLQSRVQCDYASGQVVLCYWIVKMLNINMSASGCNSS